MSNQQLALRDNGMSIMEMAKVMVESGYFADTKAVAQAAVKIMFGRELGFGPVASMQGVYIINGRPAVAANLMASAVRSRGKYDYAVKKNTNDICEIEFIRIHADGKRESLGVSTFTLADAKAAMTKNMDKFPRNMLFSRAMSNGYKWFCPDVFECGPVYTPEELGATVNEEGNVIDAQFTEPPATTPAPEPVKPAATAKKDAPGKYDDSNDMADDSAWGKFFDLLSVADESGLDVQKYRDAKIYTFGELRKAYAEVKAIIKAAA